MVSMAKRPITGLSAPQALPDCYKQWTQEWEEQIELEDHDDIPEVVRRFAREGEQEQFFDLGQASPWMPW